MTNARRRRRPISTARVTRELRRAGVERMVLPDEAGVPTARWFPMLGTLARVGGQTAEGAGPR